LVPWQQQQRLMLPYSDYLAAVGRRQGSQSEDGVSVSSTTSLASKHHYYIALHVAAARERDFCLELLLRPPPPLTPKAAQQLTIPSHLMAAI
jgi:hypothetical protein